MNRRLWWPLIALSFGLVLLIPTAATGFVSLRIGPLSRLVITSGASARDQIRLLREIRENSASLAIAVRDILLGDDDLAPSDRARLERLHQRISLHLGLLQFPSARSGARLVLRLRESQERYWHASVALLNLPASERRRSGRDLLNARLSPLRNASFDTSGELVALENSLLNAQNQQISVVFENLQTAINSAIVLSLLVGLAVALSATLYVRRLELRRDQLHRLAVSHHSRLSELNRRLIHVQEDERKTLSRELHDEIGQRLTAIQLTFANLDSADANLPNVIADGCALTSRTIAAVRNLSMGLRPSLLDDFGLVVALQWQTREFTHRSRIPVDLDLSNAPEIRSDPVRVCLYRVVQEALTNCARHSYASLVSISLHCSGDLIELRVADNGVGFQTEAFPSRGLGLFGMHERVRELGGSLSIHSAPGAGTELILCLAVEPQETPPPIAL